MTETASPPLFERHAPGRHVALALLSARDEVLLVRQTHQTRYRLLETPVERDANDEVLMQVVAALQTTLLAEGTPLTDSAWLGRFAAPDGEGRLDMLEVYVARLGQARLRRDADREMAWAPLSSPPPESMIEPAIALQVMPALTQLIDPQANTSY